MPVPARAGGEGGEGGREEGGGGRTGQEEGGPPPTTVARGTDAPRDAHPLLWARASRLAASPLAPALAALALAAAAASAVRVDEGLAPALAPGKGAKKLASALGRGETLLRRVALVVAGSLPRGVPLGGAAVVRWDGAVLADHEQLGHGVQRGEARCGRHVVRPRAEGLEDRLERRPKALQLLRDLRVGAELHPAVQ